MNLDIHDDLKNEPNIETIKPENSQNIRYEDHKETYGQTDQLKKPMSANVIDDNE